MPWNGRGVTGTHGGAVIRGEISLVGEIREAGRRRSQPPASGCSRRNGGRQSLDREHRPGSRRRTSQCRKPHRARHPAQSASAKVAPWKAKANEVTSAPSSVTRPVSSNTRSRTRQHDPGKADAVTLVAIDQQRAEGQRRRLAHSGDPHLQQRALETASDQMKQLAGMAAHRIRAGAPQRVLDQAEHFGGRGQRRRNARRPTGEQWRQRRRTQAQPVAGKRRVHEMIVAVLESSSRSRSSAIAAASSTAAIVPLPSACRAQIRWTRARAASIRRE